MIPRSRIALIATLMVLGACTNPSRFDSIPDTNAPDLTDGTGRIQTSELGDPGDPQSVAYFKASIGDTVLFDVNQHALSEEGKAILLAQATWLRQNPSHTLVIEGHADERGTQEYNLSLGARRAASVQFFLNAQGTPLSKVRTISYGKERPVETCAAAICYQTNRRAVTLLLPEDAFASGI